MCLLLLEAIVGVMSPLIFGEAFVFSLALTYFFWITIKNA